MQPPPFNANVPLLADSFAKWQINFLNNFGQLASAFSKNHVALDAASLAGNHTIIQLRNRGAPQVNSAEFALFCQNIGEVFPNNIFSLRYQNNGQIVPILYYQIVPLMPTSTQTPFFSLLPGRIICYFGTIKANAQVILSPPVARNIVSVNLTGIGQLGSHAGSVSFIKNTDGLITAITITRAGSVVTDYYYTILANT